MKIVAAAALLAATLAVPASAAVTIRLTDNPGGWVDVRLSGSVNVSGLDREGTSNYSAVFPVPVLEPANGDVCPERV